MASLKTELVLHDVKRLPWVGNVAVLSCIMMCCWRKIYFFGSGNDDFFSVQVCKGLWEDSTAPGNRKNHVRVVRKKVIKLRRSPGDYWQDEPRV